MSEHGDSIVSFDPTELRSGEPASKTDITVLSVDLRTEKSNQEELKDIKKPYEGTSLLQDEHNKDAKLCPFKPQPPSLPKPVGLGMGGKNISFEEKVRGRRLRNSQESLTDPGETGSSTDSLKEDTSSNGQGLASGRPLDLPPMETPPFRIRTCSFSETDSEHSDPNKERLKPSRIILSPLQPSGTYPPLEDSAASTSLRTTNRIDRDCLDYSVMGRRGRSERLQRNLSDSRLLDTMVSDSASVHSMKSTYSVLNPIRPRDVRNR